MSYPPESGSSPADTHNRIDALLDEIANLRGQVADRDYRITQQEQAITELRGMLAIAGRTP